MKNRSLARFVVFALIQVVLCVLAFVFAAGISSAEPEFQTDGSIYVDGTDFTPLAQLGGEILNGALSLLALGASFLVTPGNFRCFTVAVPIYCCSKGQYSHPH